MNVQMDLNWMMCPCTDANVAMCTYSDVDANADRPTGHIMSSKLFRNRQAQNDDFQIYSYLQFRIFLAVGISILCIMCLSLSLFDKFSRLHVFSRHLLSVMSCSHVRLEKFKSFHHRLQNFYKTYVFTSNMLILMFLANFSSSKY